METRARDGVEMGMGIEMGMRMGVRVEIDGAGEWGWREIEGERWGEGEGDYPEL